MPQPTLSQVHIDAALTNISTAYAQDVDRELTRAYLLFQLDAIQPEERPSEARETRDPYSAAYRERTAYGSPLSRGRRRGITPSRSAAPTPRRASASRSSRPPESASAPAS